MTKKPSQKPPKPSIVLVHGFRGSPLGLEAIANALRARGYPVYAPAMPPFAGAKDLENYTTEAYAAYLADFIRQQKLQQPVLVGHSMGSIIVAATAEKYPELSDRRVILMSPISVVPTKFFASLTPLSAGLPRQVVDYVTTRFLFVPHNRELFRQALTITHRCSNDQPPRAREVMRAAKFSAQHSIANFDLSGKEVFLLAGENDRLIPRAKTEALAKKMSAKTCFLSQSGHLHNYEKPHETAAEIWHFLEA